MMELDPVLAAWEFTAREAHSFLVMPDGCRDFIVRRLPASRSSLFISHLMSKPECVSALQGERFIGVRLKPGARINADVFDKMPKPGSLEELAESAREAASISTDVVEALSCLQTVESPLVAARDLGVSLRTLQRHTMKETGRTPDFWRRLARSRKAARTILSGSPLKEAAFACGYADQAHMTRELKQWFALTPGELAAARNHTRHSAWSICSLGYDAP